MSPVWVRNVHLQPVRILHMWMPVRLLIQKLREIIYRHQVSFNSHYHFFAGLCLECYGTICYNDMMSHDCFSQQQDRILPSPEQHFCCYASASVFLYILYIFKGRDVAGGQTELFIRSSLPFLFHFTSFQVTCLNSQLDPGYSPAIKKENVHHGMDSFTFISSAHTYMFRCA